MQLNPNHPSIHLIVSTACRLL